MSNISIYTDGSCLGNPGPGGWAAIIVPQEGSDIELFGGEYSTTNNRMELTGVIQSLRAIGATSSITLYSDSKYVVDGITKGWAEGWRRKGWRKADGKSALNQDLWSELLYLLEKHRVKFVWVRGHNGHKQNERCDALAKRAAEEHSR